MLLPHQHKAILELINAGKPLPPDMAIALLAAYDSAAQLQSANLQQVGQLQDEMASMRFKSAEALQRSDDTEREIEKRANAKTFSLQGLLKSAAELIEEMKELWGKQPRLLGKGQHKKDLAIALKRAEELLPALQHHATLELGPRKDRLLDSITGVNPTELARMRAEEPSRWK